MMDPSAIEIGDKLIHEKCFRCGKCARVLVATEQIRLVENKYLCEECALVEARPFRIHRVFKEQEEIAAETPPQPQEFLPFQVLQQGPLPDFVDVTHKEKYLAPEEFESVFGMSVEEFSKLVPWRQESLKRFKHLF
jgi:predicted RNA-binding Zn-ribbon protein involved in translation (DUF1610 family)